MKKLLLAAGVVIALSGCNAPKKDNDYCLDIGANEPQVYFPVESNGKNMILHQGHSQWTCDMRDTAYVLNDYGFTVYRAEMPSFPHHDGQDFFAETNAILESLKGQQIYMMGLSGGGWTTTMATALNPEIIKGYSVAGDHPILSYTQGDWEQKNPPLDYGEAYAIAGDRLMHIYNWYDTCCFAGVTGDIGSEYVMDYSMVGHQISPWAIDYIINDILSEG